MNTTQIDWTEADKWARQWATPDAWARAKERAEEDRLAALKKINAAQAGEDW